MTTQSSPLSQFAAVIGLDWADRKHDVCLQCAAQQRREMNVIEHCVEAIDTWAQGLRERFEGRPVAIALELEQGPIVSALRKYDFIVLFPINPASLAKYREVFIHSGAKDDPSDAELALEFLLKHPERLKPLNPQSPHMRALEQLVEMRRRLVDDQTRITNRLSSALKNYFPQVLQWFEHKDSLMFCNFLQRWPTPNSLRLARRATLERFFHEHNVRRPALIQQRIDAMKATRALTHDEGVTVPFSLLVGALIEQLRVTLQAVESFDRQIAQRAPAHPDFRIFQSLPAAGPVFAPRLLIAFGEQRERYPNAADLQRYAGVAPVTERSGNSHWVHWRWSCPAFLRQSFVEWAALTIPRSFWAAAFYRQQRAAGKSHQAALRSLAYKWIRIVHRCWIDRKPYDESTYLLALKKRGSPLLTSISA
ncbi:MAG TPA: IS110 family transposase [Nitrospiraceae bacterium]|nr:IS110 family transposase [Nitrospiraceae bacterium]